MLGAFFTSLLGLLPPLVLWIVKLRLKLLASYLSRSPRTKAEVCPPPEPWLHLDFLLRKLAGGTHHIKVKGLVALVGPHWVLG